eukprot:TRINITY_DN28090_c0_g2_i2.p2 TRINITY_DN28090_c0_g2~~TRINITY_DN28090_c0_g2_i2.p2  ORF type:complete len:181 (+),score=11.36 TRINITY_DN28090_c0_g2_i2:369-911(+)
MSDTPAQGQQPQNEPGKRSQRPSWKMGGYGKNNILKTGDGLVCLNCKLVVIYGIQSVDVWNNFRWRIKNKFTEVKRCEDLMSQIAFDAILSVADLDRKDVNLSLIKLLIKLVSITNTDFGSIIVITQYFYNLIVILMINPSDFSSLLQYLHQIFLFLFVPANYKVFLKKFSYQHVLTYNF